MTISGPDDHTGRGERFASASTIGGDVYTMEEAARLMGVSYHTVSRAVRRGRLPATRLGRMALITEEDLRAWDPMRQRAPKSYKRRNPDPAAQPALPDLAVGERVELTRRLDAATARAKAVADISLAVSGGEDPRSILQTAIDHLTELLSGQSGSVFFHEASGQMVGQIGNRMDDPAIESVTTELLTLPATLVALGRREPIVLPYSQASERERELYDRYRFRSTLIAPLLTGSEPIGAAYVNFADEEHQPTNEEISFAATLATQCAVAIERARLLRDYDTETLRLRTAIELLRRSVIVTDENGETQFASAAAQRRLGETLSAGSSASLTTIDGGPLPAGERPIEAVLRSGIEIAAQPVIFHRPNGKQIAAIIAVNVVRDRTARVIGAIVMVEHAEEPTTT